jgi:hypothetical protein
VFFLALAFTFYERGVLLHGTPKQKQLQNHRWMLYSATWPAIFWWFILGLVESELEAVRAFPFHPEFVPPPKIAVLPPGILAAGRNFVFAMGALTVLSFLIQQHRLFLQPGKAIDYGWLKTAAAISSLIGASALVLSTHLSLVGGAGAFLVFSSAKGIWQSINGYVDFGSQELNVGDNVQVSMRVTFRSQKGYVVGSSTGSGIYVRAMMDWSAVKYMKRNQELTVVGRVTEIKIDPITQFQVVTLGDARLV